MYKGILKKTAIIVLLASFGNSYSIDDIVDDVERKDMQKESEGISEKLFEAGSALLRDLNGSIKETAGSVAKWSQTKLKAAKDTLETVAQNGYTKVKESLDKGKKELKEHVDALDIEQTKESIKEHVNESLDSIQAGSKKAFSSFRSWFNGNSDSMFAALSREELMIVGGATAVAAFVLGGVTYVLYKSGAIKRIGTEMKNHKLASATGIAACALLVTSFVIYNNTKVVADKQ